jgi:Glycosyltransferase family 87
VLCLAFGIEVATRPDKYLGASDVRVYQPYGAEIVNGAVPYRDFELEYPPGALPMFVLPAAGVLTWGSTKDANWAPLNSAARHYEYGFESIVLILALATLILTATSLAALERPAGSVVLALAVISTFPVLVGDVFLGRFDIWPAAATAAGLAAAMRSRYRLGGAFVGLGAAAKIYPVLLVPVFMITAARRRGAREGVLSAAAAVGAATAVFVPFAVMSFSGTWEAVRVQFQGGLQIESFASSLLVVTSHLGKRLESLGLPPPSTLTNRAIEHGISRSVLVGSGVDTTAVVINILLAVVLLWLWLRVARNGADPREDLVRYAAATVATVLVLGSVLSPQYLIWLLPLVPLVGGKRGAMATVTFALAALLTRFWFPAGYIDYENGLDAGPATLLVTRNLALLATALVLLLPGNPFPSRPRLDSNNLEPRPSRR